LKIQYIQIICDSGLVVKIPPQIEVIWPSAFSLCEDLSVIEFARDTKLYRIYANAFDKCSLLKSICIPASVDSIDSQAFAFPCLSDVQVADGNRYFRVSGDFLLDFEGTSLVCYLGRDSAVAVPPEIEVIGEASFAVRKRLSRVEFSSDSRLRRLEICVFFGCISLRPIWSLSFMALHLPTVIICDIHDISAGRYSLQMPLNFEWHRSPQRKRL
jgi:hypothetical protein